MSIAERYLGFSTPPVISSSEFTTEFLEFQPSGSVKDFATGDSFTIALSNCNKAQFLLPDSCFLTFDVTVSAPPGAAANVPSGNDDSGVMHTVDTVPRPAFGLPYFDSATCSVPGSSNFDALPSSAEETAQYWYSTRLLASSVTAEAPLDRGATFRLPGRYAFAGGRSGLERAGCISGARRYKATGTGTEGVQGIRGNSVSMAYPLSAFSTLFCKSSALVPVGYLSSGGEALVFQFTVARDAASVLGVSPGTQGWGDVTFNIHNPRILCSIVRVQNPVTVSQISALYDGRVKAVLPPATEGAPPVSISMPMVVAHKRFLWARSLVPKVDGASINTSSAFGLTFSGVNEPSVSAIVLRFRYRPNGITTVADAALRKQAAIKYLGGEEPDLVIRDLQARINDQLVPLKGITDQGISTTRAYNADGTIVPVNSADGSNIINQTAGGVAAALFDLGRHDLGLFMEEDHASSLSDVVYDRSSALGTRSQVAIGAVTTGTANCTVGLRVDATQAVSLVEQDATRKLTCMKTPMAIYVIPLTTMPQLVGDYSNAHTLRSWDLRSVSSFSVTGSLQVKQNIVSCGTAYTQVNTFASANTSDIILDGALVCDGMLRLAAGSSDSRYVYTAVSNATVAGM